MSKLGEIFAVNIRNLRKKYSITQKMLADRLGCSEKAVSKWERGISIPDIEVLLLIAKIFHVNIESLFYDEDNVYFLGISATEPSTSLILTDRKCAVIRRIQTETIDPSTIEIEKGKDILRNAIYKICSDIDFASVIVYAGITNISSEMDQIKFVEFFKSFGFKHSHSDSLTNLFFSAALGEEDGIILIMGVGACAYGRIDGKYSSVGGRGYLLSNEGGTYSIGRDGLNAYFSQCDGTGEKTLITEEIEKNYGMDIKRIFEEIYCKDRHHITTFAQYVFAAADKNDKIAINIIKRNMHETAKLVNVLSKKFEESKIPLVLIADTMMEENRMVYFKNELENPDKFEITIFKEDTAMGAVFLARKQYEEIFTED